MAHLVSERNSDVTPAEWRPTAPYLYILHLDAIALAWEYLRRNSAYRRDWKEFGHRHPVQRARNWGLHWPGGSITRFA